MAIKTNARNIRIAPAIERCIDTDSVFKCSGCNNRLEHRADAERLKRSVIYCTLLSFLIVSVFAWTVVLFRIPLLKLFMDKVNPVALESGCTRIMIMLTVYGICATMDVFSGALRGMGYSIQSACITVFCVCVIRVGWVLWVFPHYRTLENLIWSYPVTWSLNTLACGTLFVIVYHINRKRHKKAALI